MDPGRLGAPAGSINCRGGRAGRASESLASLPRLASCYRGASPFSVAQRRHVRRETGPAAA